MSGSDINLDATNDVNIPANVGMTFGDDGEKIEGDGSHLTVFSSGDININSGTLNLSNQTVDVTLNASVDALNFDSNTLSIDALNNRVGIGTSAPDMQFHLSTSENNLMHLQSTDQDALFKISDSGGHFQINTANDNTSLGTSHSGEMMRFSSTGGPDSEEIIVFNEDSNKVCVLKVMYQHGLFLLKGLMVGLELELTLLTHNLLSKGRLEMIQSF
jgi:hypothetical protein